MIRDRGDQDALGLLDGLPHDLPPEVFPQRRRRAARSRIRSRLWSAVQNAWYGLSLGSVLLLAAIGLAITFGVMGVINMAHGEMVMLGAYTTFVVQQLIRTYDPGLFEYSLAIALPLAFLVSGAVGIVIERGIIRFLYGRPLETLLATWGLSLILQQVVRTIFGPTNKDVGNPSWMSGAFELGGITITYNRLWIIVLHADRVRGAARHAAFHAAGARNARGDAEPRHGRRHGHPHRAHRRAHLRPRLRHRRHRRRRAVADRQCVSPNLGQGYIIDSFMVVVFGGVGNLWGTLVGAFTLGIANKFLEPYAGAVLGKIAILVLIILFIQKRPRGMFALKGRAVEA